jgi:hypothetical protein
LATPPILGRFRGKQVHPDKEFHRSNESLFSKKILNHCHNRGVVRILPVICHFDFLQKCVLAIPKCVSHLPSTPSSSISKKSIGHNSVTQRPYTTSDSSASRVFGPQSVGTNRAKLARHNKRHPQRRKGHVVPHIKRISSYLAKASSVWGCRLIRRPAKNARNYVDCAFGERTTFETAPHQLRKLTITKIEHISV